MTQPESNSVPGADAAAATSTTPFVLSFTPTPVRASFIARTLAFVIDFGGTFALTAAVVWGCVTIGFSDYDGAGEPGSGYFGDGRGIFVLVGVLAIAGVPLVSTIINVRLARTRMYSIGKFIMRIRVVDVATTGPASAGTLVARCAILLVPSLIVAVAVWSLVLNGVGLSIGTVLVLVVGIFFAVPMLRGDRRGWQDRATHTRVLTAGSVQLP